MLMLGQNSVKTLGVNKIVKEIKFEGIWGESESKEDFQRKSCTMDLRLTLGSTWNSAVREKFNFYFLRVFC